MTILPEGEPTFSDMATDIRIEDEGAGEYLVITQPARNKPSIAIDTKEWVSIKKVIDQMMVDIKKHETK
jgi:hypothetical protein